MKRILVVDDQLPILELLKRYLQQLGYEATTVSSGYKAIQLFQTQPCDAVLLDLGLGDTSGLEVLKKMKKLFPERPVIVVTGCHEEAEARKAFEAGALDYVVKPIDFQYLGRVLEMQFQD